MCAFLNVMFNIFSHVRYVSVDCTVALLIHTHRNICNCHILLTCGPQWMNRNHICDLLYEEVHICIFSFFFNGITHLIGMTVKFGQFIITLV